MKNQLFIGLLFVLTISCNTNQTNYDSVQEQVTRQTVTELSKRYGFELREIGGSGLHGIASFDLGFSVQKDLTIAEARSMLVNCVEFYLKKINETPKLRPILVEFPFPATRMNFALYTTDGSYEQIRIPGELTYAWLNRGIITYETVRVKGTTRGWEQNVDMHKESYEEAKRIVEHEKNT